MKEITLKKSTHFISVIFNIASIIAIIVDIGAVLRKRKIIRRIVLP